MPILATIGALFALCALASIYWFDDHILWVGGNIAHDSDCCCDGPPPPPPAAAECTGCTNTPARRWKLVASGVGGTAGYGTSGDCLPCADLNGIFFLDSVNCGPISIECFGGTSDDDATQPCKFATFCMPSEACDPDHPNDNVFIYWVTLTGGEFTFGVTLSVAAGSNPAAGMEGDCDTDSALYCQCVSLGMSGNLASHIYFSTPRDCQTIDTTLESHSSDFVTLCDFSSAVYHVSPAIV